MDSLRQHALYLAFNELADVDTVASANLYESFVPLGIEFGADVLTVEGHRLSRIGKTKKEHLGGASFARLVPILIVFEVETQLIFGDLRDLRSSQWRYPIPPCRDGLLSNP